MMSVATMPSTEIQDTIPALGPPKPHGHSEIEATKIHRNPWGGMAHIRNTVRFLYHTVSFRYPPPWQH